MKVSPSDVTVGDPTHSAFPEQETTTLSVEISHDWVVRIHIILSIIIADLKPFSTTLGWNRVIDLVGIIATMHLW